MSRLRHLAGWLTPGGPALNLWACIRRPGLPLHTKYEVLLQARTLGLALPHSPCTGVVVVVDEGLYSLNSAWCCYEFFFAANRFGPMSIRLALPGGRCCWALLPGAVAGRC